MLDGWQGLRRFAVVTVRNPTGADKVTETISPVYTRLFGTPPREATATVRVTVVRSAPAGHAAGHAHRAGSQPHPKVVRNLSRPPRGAEPDLVALPSWGISVKHSSKLNADLLDFAATVWVAGNGPLDVEA